MDSNIFSSWILNCCTLFIKTQGYERTHDRTDTVDSENKDKFSLLLYSPKNCKKKCSAVVKHSTLGSIKNYVYDRFTVHGGNIILITLQT